MNRFLILSDCGDGVGLGLRLKVEGHDARVKVFDPIFEHQGKGFIDTASEYQFGQTVIADCTGFGSVLEAYRDAGILIFGGGVFADRLETDRKFAEEVMHEVGIDTPDSVSVKSWEDAAKQAEKFAEKSGKVVLKPEGSLSGVVPSYVASDAKDALSMLEQFKHECGSTEVELTVQEFIEGIAVSTEGWFNGEDWVPGMFNHTIERKQFLNGDIGPSGGCTGNVVWGCEETDPIVTETLIKLTKMMRKHRYVGAIDVNCVVNKDGIYGLEFTPRFGYDAFPTLLYSLVDFDFGSFIDSLARNQNPGVRLNEGYGAGVRISLPPWPNEKFHNEAGVQIQGFKQRDEEWFYPYGVMLVDDKIQSSAGVGIVGVVNGHGASIGESFARAYEIVTRLKAPGLQYRTDLCEVCLKDFRELREVIHDEPNEGWIGVDLDGTLAEYSGWSNEIGLPIPKMVQRVKRWINEGKDIRILTARGTSSKKHKQLIKIHEWVKEHIGTPLEITSEKDFQMILLYDDRVIQVDANEGTLVL